MMGFFDMTIPLRGLSGGNDDQHFCLKNTDISTGATSLPIALTVESDDFYAIGKASATVGGAWIVAMGESTSNNSYTVEAWSGAPTTTDTSASYGAMQWYAGQHNGANADVDMAANSNSHTWGEINSSAARLTRMLLKADDGELHLGNSTVAGLDAEDDALLVRAMQRESSHTGILDSQYDNPFYDYDKLVTYGLAGEKDAEGFFLFPVQPRLTAHEGAIWQTYCGLRDVQQVVNLQQEQIESMKAELKLLKG